MRYCALIFTLIAWPAMGKTLIFAAPQADPSEYRAFVLSSPVYDFPSHYLLENLPNPTSREQLADRFSCAQLSFTEGSIVQSIAEFKAVVSLAPTDQWSEDDQTVLLYSYLRLAQLEQGTAAVAWLKLAVVWARRGKLQPELFPPPLVEKFYDTRKRVASSTVSLSRFRRDFHFILINGEKIDLQIAEQVVLPDGPIHLSLLSDLYEPVSADMTTASLSSYLPAKRPWVEGSCLHSNVRWDRTDPGGKAFFNLRCASPPARPAPPVPEVVVGPDPTSFLPPIPTAKPTQQRPWLWAGIGVAVVATALVIQAHQQRSSPQPTIAEGF